MTNSDRWETLSTKVVYKNNWMSVREDKVILPNGKKGVYGVVEKNAFVIVIPFVENKVALVEQYRYPVKSKSWEFPEGLKDKTKENLRDAAIRELREETGLLANKLEEIGTLWLAPGYSNQHYTVFVSRECIQENNRLEGSETDMKVGFFTLEEVKEMVKKGIIKDSPTIAAFSLYLLSLEDKG